MIEGQIKIVTINDVELLRQLSIQTFTETFASTNTESDMQKYISENLSITKLSKELQTPNSTFYFLKINEEAIAYLKLNGTMNKPIRLPSYNIINTIVMIALIGFGGYFAATGGNMMLAWLLFLAAAVYGILFTIPIGGADMPVVISLLNSFTGLAPS